MVRRPAAARQRAPRATDGAQDPASAVDRDGCETPADRTNQATLEQYDAFHSMVCAPGAAAACIRSFNGRILFMPRAAAHEVSTFPMTGESPYGVSRLTLLKYYLLVIWSLTGLSTCLRLTTTVEATDTLGGRCSTAADVSDRVLAYLAGESGARPAEVRLVRRFRYVFRLPGLRVMMLHFASPGQLHLVEVYERDRGPWHYLLAAVLVAGLLAVAVAATT